MSENTIPVVRAPLSDEERIAKMSDLEIRKACAQHLRKPKLEGVIAIITHVSLLGQKLPGQDPYLLSRRSQTSKTYMNKGMGKVNV